MSWFSNAGAGQLQAFWAMQEECLRHFGPRTRHAGTKPQKPNQKPTQPKSPCEDERVPPGPQQTVVSTRRTPQKTETITPPSDEVGSLPAESLVLVKMQPVSAPLLPALARWVLTFSTDSSGPAERQHMPKDTCPSLRAEEVCVV